jgi:hypothetical protein
VTPARKSAPAAEKEFPKTWHEVTLKDIDDDSIGISFTRLPPDGGVVTPIAREDDVPDPDPQALLDQMRELLPAWKPGKVSDPVQRVRNFLYVAAVPDVFQLDIERFVPLLIYERLQADVPKDDLIKILYFIAVHPLDGDDTALNELRAVGLEGAPSDVEEVRSRAAFYAVKLLGRVLGRIKPQ